MDFVFRKIESFIFGYIFYFFCYLLYISYNEDFKCGERMLYSKGIEN